ncbi:MAG: hypothetical protein KGQ42_09470, partial [Alphaproteobacteria bacterium]|nr:hypothetical protein [Alphaproteobacteria bacterium]
RASYTAAIAARAQQCVSSINIGLWPGVEKIHAIITLHFAPDGTLSARPDVRPDDATLDDDNRRYAGPFRDSIARHFEACDFAGLHLPPDLYKSADGRGWNLVKFGYKWSHSG